MTYDITSPHDFTGRIGPVQFVQGRATTDHPAVVAYCRRHGYTVQETAPVVEETPEETEGPKESTKRTRKGGTGGH